MFDIALLIDLYVDPQYVVNTSNLLIASDYISIIGVVFATGELSVSGCGIDIG